MKIQRTTYLSLGSNLGNPLENLQKGINLIAQNVGNITKISSVYKTASWGFESKDFLNICIEVSSHLNPENLLDKVLKIETDLGRKRDDNKEYKARTIDIDVLLFDDEVIFYNPDSYRDLTVPHPRMLERKFVLVPLAEIAPQIKHPVAKETIGKCLKNCEDNLEIEKTDLKLNRPISIIEKYNYIAIEGNIGAGKTTLAKMIGDDFNAKLVLERFADNPFLPKYYEDMERYAFPLEMSFLADRYQQLSDDLAQFDLFKSFIVSDYYIFKSLIFAQVSLSEEEYKLYRRIFDVLYKEITKPDLYVYLYQNTESLLENIKKRGRDYEQNIKPEYLEQIHQGYVNFIKTEKGLNTLVIDVSEFDFEKNKSDYKKVIGIINKSTS
ncbi:2-amino-4-hydroxy-6-hydroxymethyldihydropteridine diphosphokinase [Aureibaculum sp. 2210JD6-5]|uniref:2-amino-4-hydroxy-6- hydroxymethyldihydropteridine diphosphokinase n=1 Tax=Aureibaculum sp. 2210JD6-5 TaxID=3103957 RepID=UPI002AAE3DA9|nr:2-amino-4-hydroxy-6-hydroxymethyldihydropteridine diphosphokinase [Aureibaculum sp. 2210JD6-5]MDY7396271.1 2-amino-4-hydroxy-6-hydroxymethyldihydropteridine diphosphokinase [Aureibaculum sp. 2210JD6-5]